MVDRAKALIKNPAISKTIIVTVGTFMGSIFAYILQVFLGRWLSVSDFGTFTALLSLYLIFGVITSAALTSLVKLVAQLSSENKFDTLTQMFINLSTVVLSFGGFLFAIVVIAKGLLAKFLGIDDVTLFYFFGFFVGVSFLTMLPNAYLQGMLRFRSYAFFAAFTQFMRLGLAAGAVMLGFGLYGVFGGMAASVLVVYLVGVLLLKRNFSKFEKTDLGSYYNGMMVFARAVLFTQVGMTLLNNVDVILVKHFFDSNSAGIYAGMVTIGKVLLFGASTVGVVMFPMISSAFGKGEDYLSKFKPLLFLQVLVVLLGVGLFFIFPELITRVMFGPSYAASAVYLPRFALFVGSYVLINFMILFLLAINKVRVFLLLIPAIVAQIVLISLYHDSIVSVVNVNLAVSASLLIGVVLYFTKNVSFSNSTSIQTRGDNPAEH